MQIGPPSARPGHRAAVRAGRVPFNALSARRTLIIGSGWAGDALELRVGTGRRISEPAAEQRRRHVLRVEDVVAGGALSGGDPRYEGGEPSRQLIRRGAAVG